MPEKFDDIERAIEEAKGKVAESYRDAPTKQDLMSSYQLTESEIDGLRADLEERLSLPGRKILEEEVVYFGSLGDALEALDGGKSTGPRKFGRRQREILLKDLQQKIEQGPAEKLVGELAKREPTQLAKALLACMEERPKAVGALTVEPPEEPPEEPGPAPIGEFEPRDCDLADELDPASSPEFTTIPAPKNDLDHVGAARKLAYVVAVGEDMRVLAAAATLRNRWADGQYEFCTDDLRNNLYCDMRSCDCGILPDTERLALYAAVFGLTGEDLPAGARVNRGFSGMWERFNDTVLRFLMSDEDTEASAATKKEGILAATIDLQSNLAAHVTEVDMMRITDLHKQVLRELELFNDPAVFDTVAPGCTTGWWEVVERLTGPPEDGRSLIASYELARRRDAIFEWVATFTFPGTLTGTVFDDMVNAVSALSATAPWMPAMISQDRPAITGRNNQLQSVYPQLAMARSAG